MKIFVALMCLWLCFGCASRIQMEESGVLERTALWERQQVDTRSCTAKKMQCADRASAISEVKQDYITAEMCLTDLRIDADFGVPEISDGCLEALYDVIGFVRPVVCWTGRDDDQIVEELISPAQRQISLEKLKVLVNTRIGELSNNPAACIQKPLKPSLLASPANTLPKFANSF